MYILCFIIKLIDWWAGGRCVVMEGLPNAVVTHQGGIHGDPVTAQHHGTRHTGKTVERSKEHTYQGRGGRGAKQPTSLRLIRDDQWVQQSRPSEHVGNEQALWAFGVPHEGDRWPAGLEVYFA